MTRRTILAATLLAGCGRQLARRYFGWLFIASATDKALAVADLSEFRRVTAIPLGQVPGQVFRAGKKVFVSCPEGRVLFEIDPESFRISGRISFPGRIAGCAICPDESRIAVITDVPGALHLIDPVTRRVVNRIALQRVTPSGLDVSNDLAAISTDSGVIRVSLQTGRVAGATELDLRPGIVRLHAGAKLILIGAADRNELVTVDAASGQLLARLPLAFTPARFCFNSDAGQMFVTGTSGDQIAIVSPYQNEVDQTIVAGRTPCGMAAGADGNQNLLFVTNPDSGDLTIFDIDFRQHVASVHVGGKPGEVLLTPDGEYALTVDQESGDVAVVHLKTVLDRRGAIPAAPRVQPIFTIFPTGGLPQSAAIVPEQRQA